MDIVKEKVGKDSLTRVVHQLVLFLYKYLGNIAFYWLPQSAGPGLWKAHWDFLSFEGTHGNFSFIAETFPSFLADCLVS